MPAKKSSLADEDRAKRIQETAREIGTDDDPKTFEKAFERVVKQGRSVRRDAESKPTKA